MKIKLTNEQIESIANVVVEKIGAAPKARRVPRRIAAVCVRVPRSVVALPPKAAGVNENVLLTVRADVAAIAQAIRNGSQKHALELSEHLLGHVEEILAER